LKLLKILLCIVVVLLWWLYVLSTNYEMVQQSVCCFGTVNLF